MSDPHPTDTTQAAVAHHDASHDAEHIARHLKGYFVVGGILIFFTALTVALSYVDFGSLKANWIIAMAVATFKVGLVAAIFMHLKGERWTIWQFLLFTLFFVAGLFLLTLLAWGDPIWGTHHTLH